MQESIIKGCSTLTIVISGVASGRAGRAQKFRDKKMILIFLPLCYLKPFS